MRILKIATVVIFVASLCFSAWAGYQYSKNLDIEGPVLTSSVKTLELSVADGQQALLQGLKAEDSIDGDLTDQIVVASVSHFIEKGTVNVKYVVFDSHNNAASLTRQVHYTDYRSPNFLWKKPRSTP